MKGIKNENGKKSLHGIRRKGKTPISTSEPINDNANV